MCVHICNECVCVYVCVCHLRKEASPSVFNMFLILVGFVTLLIRKVIRRVQMFIILVGLSANCKFVNNKQNYVLVVSSE